jgi:osmotically-inducible protein OsmY
MRQFMRVWFLTTSVFALTLSLFSSGCASSTTGKQKETEPNPALRAMGEPVKAGEAVSNEDIGFEIRRRLNDNPGESAGIIVEVDEGKVMLRGVAPTLAAAWRAEGAAKSVKGVKEVTNRIIVPGALR